MNDSCNSHQDVSGSALSADQVADIAHELRSPLGGIEAMIELLDSTALDAQQERLVAALRQSAAHLRAVASDLIDQRGEFSAAPRQPSSIRACLAAFEPSCAARAQAKGLVFRSDVADACGPALVASGRHLRQILENLSDNAIRLMDAGELTLRVLPVVEQTGQAFVEFSILDQGPGLEGDQTRRIFGRRVTLEGRSAGAGLGLSIVRDLVERHGGACGAEGRDRERGARLWFTMPVVGYLAEESPADPAGGSVASYRRVLVVDDHGTSQQVLKTILDHLGFEATVTGSPLQALRMAQDERFVAIFSDMSMPEMDGCEFVAALKALPAPASTCPVIGVTGRVGGLERAQFLKAGGGAFVEKPIGIAALKRALESVGFILAPERRAAV